MEEDIKKQDAEKTAEAVETAETADNCDCGANDANDANDKKEKAQKPERDKEKKAKSELRELKAELESAKAELASKNEALSAADDKYLRLLAEYDNFRRRSKEEKDAVYSTAVGDTVVELLPLFDNLELASKYTGADSEGAAKGVEMILSSIPAILEKIGVTAFGEPGDPFDPNIHNAVMHEEDETLGENVVKEVFQKGYRHGDKIIRFAMVKAAN